MTEDRLWDLINRTRLYQGSELQVAIGGMAFCIYRKKTFHEQYAFYTATEGSMRGPSGRKNVKRASWNRRPSSACEMTLEGFINAINEAISHGVHCAGAWLINPGNKFQRWITDGELGVDWEETAE